MKCKQLELALLAVTDGRASASERQLVESHVAICSACARRLEELRSVWSALDAVPAAEPSPAFDSRLRTRMAEEPSRTGRFAWFPARLRMVAAVAALAVAVLWISLRPTIYHPGPTPAEVQSQEDFTVVKNLPVLEDYDVVSSLDALSALPGAQSAASAPEQPID